MNAFRTALKINFLMIYTFSALTAQAQVTHPYSGPQMMRMRKSDELTPDQAAAGLRRAQEDRECLGTLTCNKSFPFLQFVKEKNPEIFDTYQRAHQSSDEANIASPMVTDPKRFDSDWAATWDAVEKRSQDNLLFNSAMRRVVTDLPGTLIGLVNVPAGMLLSGAGDVASTYADDYEKKSSTSELQAQRNKADERVREIRAGAEAARLAQAKKDFDDAIAKGTPAQQEKITKDAQEIADKISEMVDIRSKAVKKNLTEAGIRLTPEQAKHMGATDKWQGQSQDARLNFEVGRAVIPPDKLYDLVSRGEISLPQGVKLEDIKADAEKYMRGQEYAQIKALAGQVQQIGSGMISIAANLGMSTKTAEVMDKALSIGLSVVVAFCPPSPVNIALAVVSIIGTLMSRSGGDNTGKILNQIVKMQQDILVQIRMMRTEMHKNHAEEMQALQTIYATLQFETTQLRSLLTGEIKRQVFGRCNVIEDDFKRWSKTTDRDSQANVYSIETYIGTLSRAERMDFVTCLNDIHTLLLGETAADFSPFFVSAMTPKDDDMNRDKREEMQLTGQLRAQNNFDALLKYSETSANGKGRMSYLKTTLPARNYFELKRQLAPRSAEPEFHSTELVSANNFKKLILGTSLETTINKVLLLSMASSNIDLDANFLDSRAIATNVKAGLASGYNKRVYGELKILQDLLAIARGQQNLLNGGMLIPQLWSNLNRGLAVLHYQRLKAPSHLGPAPSKNYEQTLSIIEENPQLGSNVIAWGLWERAGLPDRDGILPNDGDFLKSYRDAYSADSAQKLLEVFGEFHVDKREFDSEDQNIISDKNTDASVPDRVIPNRVRSWEDPGLRFVCWKEQDLITQISIAYRKKSDVIKLEMIKNNRDLTTGRVIDEAEEQTRAKIKKIAENEIAELETSLDEMKSCPPVEKIGDHKWFVKFPKSGQFTALPLPEKMDNFELYSTRSADMIYELAEKVELELYDYEWEYWKNFYKNP